MVLFAAASPSTLSYHSAVSNFRFHYLHGRELSEDQLPNQKEY